MNDPLNETCLMSESMMIKYVIAYIRAGLLLFQV